MKLISLLVGMRMLKFLKISQSPDLWQGSLVWLMYLPYGVSSQELDIRYQVSW